MSTPTEEPVALLLVTQEINRAPLQTHYPTLQLALADLVQLFEDHLQQHNPNAVVIAYNLGQLFAFLESFYNIALIIKISNGKVQTYDRKWIIDQLTIHLQPRVSLIDGRITAWCGNARSMLAHSPQQFRLVPYPTHSLENQPSTSDCSAVSRLLQVHQQLSTFQQVNAPQPDASVATPIDTHTTKLNSAKRQQAKAEPKSDQLQPENQSSSMEEINHIKTQVCKLKFQINILAGGLADEHYYYLYEMLSKQLHLLEAINYDGREAIEKAWTEAAECIHECLTTLKTHSKTMKNPQTHL